MPAHSDRAGMADQRKIGSKFSMPYEYGVTTKSRYFAGCDAGSSPLHPAKTGLSLNRSFSVFFNAPATNAT